jgi:hypothetical protein
VAVSESARQVREDAFEFFVTEAARIRLVDRRGVVRLHVRSGAVVTGELSAHDDGECLELVDSSGRTVLVPVAAVSSIRGSRTALRDESRSSRPRSLASRLREHWSSGTRLRVLLHSGEWIAGVVTLVAADHVELVIASESCVVPFAAAEAWDLGPAV